MFQFKCLTVSDVIVLHFVLKADCGPPEEQDPTVATVSTVSECVDKHTKL